ncbi:lecithin retinol acyltransferase family protein [Taibaiella chishuiensis]
MVQRALALRGKAYNLITYNCEHYANEVQYGKQESRQVQMMD